MKAIDAASKAYLALIKASESLFLKEGIKEEELPKTYRGQRYLMNKFGRREQIEDFYLLREIFHIDAYYDGIIDFEELHFYINDVLPLFVKEIEDGRTYRYD